MWIRGFDQTKNEVILNLDYVYYFNISPYHKSAIMFESVEDSSCTFYYENGELRDKAYTAIKEMLGFKCQS